MKTFLSTMSRKEWVVSGLFFVVFVAFGVGAWYAHNTIARFESKLLTLQNNIASTSDFLAVAIDDTRSALSLALETEKQNISSVRSQLGSFESEVGEISGTVNTLEKLSKTDPELLQKYSKVFFLNEHYTPERLTPVEARHLYIESQPELVHYLVWPHLKQLLVAAENQGVTLYVRSAFRSFSTQATLKGAYTVTYGAGTANTFSADQGYSEHQLGTTVDFITTGLGGKLDGFEGTLAYQWLLQNAHQYGFTLSYPPNNTYYVFEPWHWRYVGVELATHLKTTGKYFYDLNQREIDEYFVNLFD